MSFPLGAFDLTNPFAKGGMGEIWRGRHRTTGTFVAVKVLTAEGLREDRLVSAIHSEVRAAAGLAHPNIVWLYDAGTADATIERASEGAIRAGCPWFAMEMAAGGTLRERAHALSWISVRRVLLDLLDALGHAHARGVIHRDLKPSNVLFMNQGTRIKLADFGMVYAIEGPDTPLSGGTPSFMAPEQFEGDGRIQGPWTDLYSLGCVAWSLISGHRPFHGVGGASALYRQHAVRPVPPLKPRFPIPDGLQAWVEKLMAKAPGNRFQRAAEAANALIELPMPAEVDTIGESETLMQADSETQRTTLAIPAQARRVRKLAPERSAVEIPAEWRGPDRRTGDQLMGAGLGLFGLRELPFVGREEERDVLWASLREANAEQQARVVVLRGPSGYGKSRLAEWTCRRAHEVGAAEVFLGTHHRAVRAQDGLTGLLGRALRAHGLDQHELRDHVEQLLPGAPDWASQGVEFLCLPFFRSPPTRPVLELETMQERHAVVSRVVRELGRGRVATMFLDDVQWGAESLEWVKWVLQRQDAGPALILLTAQEEALVERVDEDVLLEEIEELGARTCTIGPLDEDARRDLSRSLLALDPALSEQLAERTAGNPLFAVQIVGDWVARGLLDDRGDAGFALRPGSEVALPEAVEAVWDARISALLEDRPAWAVPLEIAAVMGMDVQADEWAEACETAGTRAAPQLVLRLLAERLAVLDPDAVGRRWRFAHGMLRETLMDRSRREGRLAELHRACAAALDRDDPERADRLARHLLGAGDEEGAVDALYAAALHAQKKGLARAIDRLQRREAILASRGVMDARRIDGWYQLARMDRLRGAMGEARQWANRVLDHADDRAQIARAQLELAIIERTDSGQLSALEHLEIAGAMARELGDRELQGNVLVEQSAAFQQVGDSANAERTIRATLALRGASVISVANARLHLAYVLGALGRPEEGLAELESARPSVLQLGRRHTVANLYNTEGELARMVGDLDRAEAAYHGALKLAEQLGYPFYSFTLNLGLVALERDRILEAEAYFRGVLDHPRVSAVYSTYAALGLLAAGAARADWRSVTHLRPAIDNAPPLYQPDVFDLLLRTARHARDDERIELARWAIRHAQEQASQLADPVRKAAVDALERSLPA
ncbi:MAG: protein kinase [Myxococcota bacterium]